MHKFASFTEYRHLLVPLIPVATAETGNLPCPVGGWMRRSILARSLQMLNRAKTCPGYPGAKAVGIGTASLSRSELARRSSCGDRIRPTTSSDVISRVFDPFSAAGYVAGDFNK